MADPQGLVGDAVCPEGGLTDLGAQINSGMRLRPLSYIEVSFLALQMPWLENHTDIYTQRT